VAVFLLTKKRGKTEEREKGTTCPRTEVVGSGELFTSTRLGFHLLTTHARALSERHHPVGPLQDGGKVNITDSKRKNSEGGEGCTVSSFQPTKGSFF